MKARQSILLALLTLMVFGGSCTRKTPALNLLVWEGYADPSFVKAFEEQHHCKVSASYMGSSDELVAKCEQGPGLTLSSLVNGCLPEIEELIQFATWPSPEDRFNSTQDFLVSLEKAEEALLEDLTAPARGLSLGHQGSPPHRPCRNGAGPQTAEAGVPQACPRPTVRGPPARSERTVERQAQQPARMGRSSAASSF